MSKNTVSNIIWKNDYEKESKLEQILTTGSDYNFYNGTVLSLSPMAYPRLKHGAALLNDGSVLLTGGCGLENSYFQRLDTAELFNPRTGKSHLVKKMSTRRTRNDCITLDNGKVLIVGGCTWMLSAHDSCELFDPIRQTFSLCSNKMHQQRSAPQIIKLHNGKILIAGHSNQPELYLPDEGIDGVFHAIKCRMKEEKGFFTLTQLQNNNVLICGGEDKEGKILSSVEVFNPLDENIIEINPMQQERKNHYAVCLDDGTVLIGGGTNQNGIPLDNVELFDPENLSFTRLNDTMNVARSRPCAIRMCDGNVLVSGDSEYLEVYIASEKKFKPVCHKVTLRKIEWSGKAHRLVSLKDNTILISGGVWGNEPVELFVPEGVTPFYRNGVAGCAPMMSNAGKSSAIRMPQGNVIFLTNDGTSQIFRHETDSFYSTTDTIKTKRSDAAIAVLRNGLVLITGGKNVADGTPLQCAELYDPVTDEFKTTSPMNAPKQKPAAVNLTDGRVLILGSDSGAELYDYRADLFTKTKNEIPEQREEYCAVLMGVGIVMISGGKSIQSGKVLHSVALFDPSGETFTKGYPMEKKRAGHFMITLRNGNVLAGGGYGDNDAPQLTLELYQTKIKTWVVLECQLPEVVIDAKAILLSNGKILICGGKTSVIDPKPNSYIFILDPRTYLFTTVVPSERLYQRTIVLLKDSRVLLAGGIDKNGQPSGNTEIYCPGDEFCTVRVADMLFPRNHNLAYCFTSGKLKDKVLVTCGTKLGALSGPEAEIYDPSTDTWRQTGTMNQPKRLSRYWSRPDGKFMIFGGDGPFSLLKEVEIYDPETELWVYGPDSLSQERGCPVSTVLNNGLFIVIGTHPERCDLFDTTGKRVGETGPYSFGRGLPGLVHWRGSSNPGEDVLLLIGGYHGPTHRIPYCEMYFAKTNSWKRIADMNYARGHLREVCAITKDDLVFVPGGWDNNNVPLDTAELYDRKSDTWSILPDTMCEKRGGHITQLLPNGHYLLLGNGVGAEYYDHATGLFTWAGKVHGPYREQFAYTQLSDGSFLYVGGAGKISEKFIP